MTSLELEFLRSQRKAALLNAPAATAVMIATSKVTRPAVPTISSNRPVRPKKPSTNDIVDNDKNARGPSASASPNPSPPSASPAKENHSSNGIPTAAQKR